MKSAVFFIIFINLLGCFKASPLHKNPLDNSFTSFLLGYLGTFISVTATVFAGSGSAESVDGKGTSASFNSPTGITYIPGENVYYVIEAGNVIRKVDMDANVTTVSGSLDYPCDSCSTLNTPKGIAFDSSGNMYIADSGNNLIRKVSSNGSVSTFAGSGTEGTVDGTGTAAQFSRPTDIVIDTNDNLFVRQGGLENSSSGGSNCSIRKITSVGVVTTFVGSGTCGTLDGTGIGANIENYQGGMVIDSSNNIFLAHFSKIRKITSSGVVTTVAGGGSGDGNGTSAGFGYITALTMDSSQNLYVIDSVTSSYKIRKITTSYDVTTLVTFNYNSSGCVPSYSEVSISNLCYVSSIVGLSVSLDPNVFYMNYGSYSAKINLSTKRAQLLATNYSSSLSPFASSRLYSYNDKLYFIDYSSHYIYDYNNGIPITIAGVKANPGSKNSGLNFSEYGIELTDLSRTYDGKIIYKSSSSGYSLSSNKFVTSNYGYQDTDSKGNYYYTSGNTIRKIDLKGSDSLFAGSTSGGSEDGTTQTAQFLSPNAVIPNSDDTLFVLELSSNRYRLISTNGYVTTNSTSSNVPIYFYSGYTLLKYKDNKNNIYFIPYNSNSIPSTTNILSPMNRFTTVKVDTIVVGGMSSLNPREIDSDNNMLFLVNNKIYRAALP